MPASSSYLIRPCRTDEFESVVALGDKYRSTLGHMRFEAYKEYLAAGMVLGAYLGETLCAYALYALPRREVRLAHLVVDEHHRHKKIAARLVSRIRKEHGHLRGISVKCRPDWEANDMWPALGFVPRGVVAGRAASGSELTSWWLSFDHGDLFTLHAENTTELKVVLDTNVIRDLLSNRPGSEESRVLEAPWLSGEVLFCTTNAVQIEVNKVNDAVERKRALAAVGSYTNIHTRAQEVLIQAKFNEWMAAIPDSELARDPSARQDGRLIAEAAIAGADVFVTRDRNAARIFDPLASVLGLRVLAPSELAVHVDSIQRAAHYSPMQIQQSSVSIVEAEAGLVSNPRPFLNMGAGERMAVFRKRLVDCAGTDSELDKRRRVVYLGEGKDPVALLATSVDRSASTLEVPVFRVVRGAASQTLALQLLFLLRREARAQGLNHIIITDGAAGPDPRVKAVLRSEGLWQSSRGCSMVVIDETGDLDYIQRVARKIFMSCELEAGPLAGILSTQASKFTPELTAEMERLFWPAKIENSVFPNYIVPIRPQAASRLLGHDQSLFARPQALGLSRQHVYYKSPNVVPKAPGRVLWYESGIGQVIACSRIVHTRVGAPEQLFERFRALGVWGLRDIERVADSRGRAAALAFADTEIFARQIPYGQVKGVAARMGVKLGTLPGTRPVPAELFMELYRQGTGNGTTASN